MSYGTFDRGSLNDPIHHVAVDYRRALCSGSRLATITHQTGATPHEFHGGRLCKKCVAVWDEQVSDR